MNSSDEADDGDMRFNVQVVIPPHTFEVFDDRLIQRWITWIIRAPKADRQGEYIFSNLGKR